MTFLEESVVWRTPIGRVSFLDGIAHEKWVWDIRQEPGIVEAFADLWKTDDFLVLFDGM